MGSLERVSWVLVVRNEHALGLLVVLEHYQATLAVDIELPVTTEGCVGRVAMIIVRPHTTGLDAAGSTIDVILVATSHTGAKAIGGVIGNLEGLVQSLEGCHGQGRAEDLLTGKTR